jgi:curli biogenesis system outer membrane secretion channel CsgG
MAADILSKPDKFDEEEILTGERLGTKYDTIIIKDYSTKGAEIANIDDEEKKMLKDAEKEIVKALTESTVKHLKEQSIFKRVEANSSLKRNAVILQGKITKFNGGVGAAKWFLGFAAPKSTKTNISIDAELVDATTGTVLVKIKDVRSGGEGNILGSRNMTKAFIVQAQDEGKELAEFIKEIY